MPEHNHTVGNTSEVTGGKGLPRIRTRFATLLKAHRERVGKRHRDMAEIARVAPSTYSNAESSPHRVMRRDKVDRLAAGLGLEAAAREELLAAYDELPVSEFQARRRERFDRMRAARKAEASAGEIRAALVNLLATRAVEGDECVCGLTNLEDPAAGRYVCELCIAMRALGLESWDRPTAEILASLDGLEGSTGFDPEVDRPELAADRPELAADRPELAGPDDPEVHRRSRGDDGPRRPESVVRSSRLVD